MYNHNNCTLYLFLMIYYESKFIEDVSQVPYTPAKQRVMFDDDDGQCQFPDSPLISISKYKKLKRHSTVIKMTNIDDLPSSRRKP